MIEDKAFVFNGTIISKTESLITIHNLLEAMGEKTGNHIDLLKLLLLLNL